MEKETTHTERAIRIQKEARKRVGMTVKALGQKGEGREREMDR